MGPPTAQPHQRSPQVHARTPCSTTLEATRPDALHGGPRSLTRAERPRFRPVTDDFSLFTNRSSVVRSSHPAAHPPVTASASAAESWSPVLYDPTSDSVRIIPPGRRTPLVSQFREFKDKINGVKHGVHAHRLAGLLSLDKPASQPLPFRTHEPGGERSLSRPEIHHLVPSNARLGRTDWKEFDLMAAPPGRRTSYRATQDDSATRPPQDECEDANPSKALTSQIASSIMQERQHLRGCEAAPPPLPSKDRSQWKVHRMTKSQSSSIGGSRASLVRSAQKPRSVPSGRRPAEEDDDPFAYDKPELYCVRRRASSSAIMHVGTEVELGDRGFPCPFRRRNPVMFNVRDHEHCAQRPFSDMPGLRRHIRTFHRRDKASHHCPRCKKAFENEGALGDHLTVPVEEMCQPRPTTSAFLVEDGISEAMDRVLADSPVQIKTWEEMWWLLFPQDTTVLEPEIIPVVEAIEAEQEFDDSSAELKADLCDALQRILPDQAAEGPLAQVLAGQVSLVLEQHRAKVLRRCRNKASISDKPAFQDRATKTKATRYSVAATAYGSQAGYGRPRPSLHSERARRSQTQGSAVARRTSVSPSSSVYSQGSSGSQYSLASTGHQHALARRTSSISSVGGVLPVESPRLPFRDWVHTVKLNHANSAGTAGKGVVLSSQPPSERQRDSGLALQCEECRSEECRCESYADQLSAFQTPAPGAKGVGSFVGAREAMCTALEDENDDGDDDANDDEWAELYGGRSLATGRPAEESGKEGAFGLDKLGRDAREHGLLRMQRSGKLRPQGEFI